MTSQMHFISRGKKCDSVFKQVARHVLKQTPKDLCFPSRAWKIRLVDEAADDAGGVFDEIMTEMCQVIQPVYTYEIYSFKCLYFLLFLCLPAISFFTLFYMSLLYLYLSFVYL